MKNNRIVYFGLYIALLNLFDGFATYYGLSNNLIEEANPLMDFLWTTSPIFFLQIKLLLSISIAIISYLVYQGSNSVFQRIYFYILTVVSLIYSGVFFLHIYWIAIVLKDKF